MNILIAGAASGLLFASMSVAFGCFAIFVMYRNGIGAINDLFSTSAPSKIILSSLMVWNPTCVVIGILFALLFSYLSDIRPGSGLFSPNFFYTFFVIGISLLLPKKTWGWRSLREGLGEASFILPMKCF